jgi:hypothetical protein
MAITSKPTETYRQRRDADRSRARFGLEGDLERGLATKKGTKQRRPANQHETASLKTEGENLRMKEGTADRVDGRG